MITTREWIAFKKHVTSCFMKRIKSKEYKKLINLEIEQFSPITEKHKFLWWNWETTRFPIYSFEYLPKKWATEEQRALVETMYPIPDESIEECLNWLTTKKNRGLTTK